MATINAVVVPAKILKNGKHKIRISIAHNGETRYILTNIVIDSVKEFRNGAVVKRPDASFLNTKLRSILQTYQERIDEIKYINCLSCPEVVYLLKNGPANMNLSIQQVFDEYINMSTNKPSCIRAYKSHWNVLKKFINTDMPIQNLTMATVQKTDIRMFRHNYKPSSINIFMMLLRTVTRYAMRNGYAKYNIYPFDGYKSREMEVRDSWISCEDIRKIRDITLTKSCEMRARDYFMLSYYLGGINMADLLHINFNSPKLKYIRTKTNRLNKINKYVEFDIPHEAWEIIKRYRQSDGRLFATENQRKYKCSSMMSDQLKKIARILEIDNLVFYSARKSFAQHAFNLGIESSVIDYILGHKLGRGGSSLYSYIYVTPEKATAAIRKVLDNLK